MDDASKAEERLRRRREREARRAAEEAEFEARQQQREQRRKEIQERQQQRELEEATPTSSPREKGNDKPEKSPSFLSRVRGKSKAEPVTMPMLTLSPPAADGGDSPREAAAESPVKVEKQPKEETSPSRRSEKPKEVSLSHSSEISPSRRSEKPKELSLSAEPSPSRRSISKSLKRSGTATKSGLSELYLAVFCLGVRAKSSGEIWQMLAVPDSTTVSELVVMCVHAARPGEEKLSTQLASTFEVTRPVLDDVEILSLDSSLSACGVASGEVLLLRPRATIVLDCQVSSTAAIMAAAGPGATATTSRVGAALHKHKKGDVEELNVELGNTVADSTRIFCTLLGMPDDAASEACYLSRAETPDTKLPPDQTLLELGIESGSKLVMQLDLDAVPEKSPRGKSRSIVTKFRVRSSSKAKVVRSAEAEKEKFLWTTGPKEVVHLLRTQPTTLGIIQLRARLMQCSAHWYRAFMAAGGSLLLFELLGLQQSAVNRADDISDITAIDGTSVTAENAPELFAPCTFAPQCIKCVLILMNDETGIEECLSVPAVGRKLASLLTKPKMMPWPARAIQEASSTSLFQDVLGILTALTSVSESGLETVRDGLVFFGERFKSTMRSLSKGPEKRLSRAAPTAKLLLPLGSSSPPQGRKGSLNRTLSRAGSSRAMGKTASGARPMSMVGVAMRPQMGHTRSVSAGFNEIPESEFAWLVQRLEEEKVSALQVSWLLLMNSMIGAPEEVSERIAMRQSFIDAQMLNALASDALKVSSTTNPALRFQIQKFARQRDFDKEEVEMLADATLRGVDFGDPSSVFDKLVDQVQDVKEDRKLLLSIIRRLLAIPSGHPESGR
jgi:Diaphanous FH3 Domain